MTEVSSLPRTRIGGVARKKEERMDLIKYEPLRNLMTPLRGLEDFPFINRFFRLPLGFNTEEALTVADWTPVVDINETEKEYLIKAEIPEVKKEDVKVLVEEGVLTLQGERKQEKEEKGKKFHRIERSYGSFLRTFTVPADADEGKVTAEFKDGMLYVHLPKTEKITPKAHEVKVS
jgi:HSP20 family protein